MDDRTWFSNLLLITFQRDFEDSAAPKDWYVALLCCTFLWFYLFLPTCLVISFLSRFGEVSRDSAEILSKDVSSLMTSAIRECWDGALLEKKLKEVRHSYPYPKSIMFSISCWLLKIPYSSSFPFLFISSGRSPKCSTAGSIHEILEGKQNQGKGEKKGGCFGFISILTNGFVSIFLVCPFLSYLFLSYQPS